MILFVLFALPGAAHEQLNGSGFLVQTWHSEEGLPGNVVRSIGQSSDGFLWISTAEGLTRFDGHRFEGVTIEAAQTSQSENLFRVFTPKNGSIWVSSYEGSLYRVSDGILATIPLDKSKVGDGLASSLFLHEGSLHIHYNDRLWLVDPDGTADLAPETPELARAFEEDARPKTRPHIAAVTAS